MSPLRPIGVYVLRANGDTDPAVLEFKEIDDEGMNVWVCHTPVFPGDQLKVGMFPGHTTIEFPVVGGDAD